MTMLSYLVLACMVYHGWAAAPCDNAQQLFAQFHTCNSSLWDYSTHDPTTSANEFNLFLKQACSTGMPAFKTCMANAISGCDQKLKGKLDGWYTTYHDDLCDGNQLKEIFNVGKDKLYKTLMSENSCLGSPPEGRRQAVNRTVGKQNMMRCFGMAQHTRPSGSGAGKEAVVIAMDADISNVKLEDHEDKLKWFGKGMINCMRRYMKRTTTCDAEERKIVMTYFRMQYMPLGFDIKSDDIRGEKHKNARSKQRTTVKLFGLTHVMPYINKAKTQVDDAETCALAGRQMLFENDNIQIFGNFTPGKAGGQANYIEDLEVTILNKLGEVVAEYIGIGQDASFGETFRNGKKEVDMDDKSDQVKIKSLRNGKFMRISHPKSGSFIGFAKKKNKHHVFSLRLADEVWEDAQGILVTGCLNKLDRAAAASGRKKRSTCSQCSGTYQNFCSFDCREGDTDLAGALGTDVDGLAQEALDMDSELSGAATFSTNLLMLLAAFLIAKLT